MAYNTPGLNASVDGIAAAGTYVSMHTADPGTTGANQTGNRAQTTWGAASSGSRVGSQVAVAIGAGVTITHWSVWTAATNGTGTCLGSWALTTPETFGAAGTYQFTPTLNATN